MDIAELEEKSRALLKEIKQHEAHIKDLREQRKSIFGMLKIGKRRTQEQRSKSKKASKFNGYSRDYVIDKDSIEWQRVEKLRTYRPEDRGPLYSGISKIKKSREWRRYIKEIFPILQAISYKGTAELAMYLGLNNDPMSVPEIALLKGRSSTTIQSRIRRALRYLKHPSLARYCYYYYREIEKSDES